MQAALRNRFLIYALALVLAAAGLLAAGLFTAHERDFWESQLRTWHFDSVQLATEGKARFHDLNRKLLRYEFSRAAEDRAEFDQAADDLAQWLEKQTQASPIRETQDNLRQLAVAYSRFRASATEFLATLPPATAIHLANPELLTVETEANNLLALDARLGARQREAFQSLIGRARSSLDIVLALVYVGLALVLLFVAAGSWTLFRHLINPLRRSVRQSRLLLERQEKLRSLGLVTAGLAHEIRNPLNSIKARLYTQRRALGPNSPGLEDNQFIDEEIDRLEAVVKDALAFARPGEPAWQELQLSALLESFGELLGPALADASIRLVTDVQFNPKVSADPNQLKQALLNLINNAKESIGRQGVITLRTRPAVFPRGRQRAPAVALEVQDTGQGVPRENRARLFDPFFTTKEHGTGLGLSLTARIVEAHHGVIECESKPGCGALFRILLPVAHEKDPHLADRR